MDEKQLLKNLLEIRMIANEMIPKVLLESLDSSDEILENLTRIIRFTDVAAEAYKKEIGKVTE